MTSGEWMGARVEEGVVRFVVWAPTTARVDIVLDEGRRIAMERTEEGMHRAVVEGLGEGTRYRLSLDGGPPLPDPASRFQPEGVHGPSEVIDPSFPWRDSAWRGVGLADAIVYELHVGALTPDGTFEAARALLPDLRELGVTVVELMPLHDFPGARGWGYDPAAFFAPARVYGRPDDLRRLIDDAHALGIAVWIDVVYNHLGPDGAYWAAYGPVLTDRHETPWGRAVNLDAEHARGVRDFLVQNALSWLGEYHADGLRLDATFALVDDSPEHFLAELSRRVAELPGPKRHLIAEDDRNLARVIEPRERGGFGLDGVWADDFHHLVRRIVAGDRHGYFRDYPDDTAALARCIEGNWYFTGQPAEHWGGKPRGTPADHLARERFVYCIQNHDQIGNRPRGDRLTHAVDLATYRAASALLLFAPQTPLLFMGQEHAASSPFRYFTDHEPELGAKVREGRKREFRDFPGFSGEVPDPQGGETFGASVLDWSERRTTPHCEVLRLYRDLIALRRELSGEVRAKSPAPGIVVVERGRHALAVCLKGSGIAPLTWPARVRLDTDAKEYGGMASAPALASEGARFDGPRALVLERLE